MAQPALRGEGGGDLPDAALVTRSLQGRQDAFEALFDRYARQVYNIAYRISGSPTEAEDLTQDVFLRAFRTLDTLRQPQAVAAWLYQMATNVCLDALRRHRVPQAELSEAVVALHPDASRWGSPEAMALAGDDQRAVWEALGRLAPSQRAALTLREVYGLNYGEIATTLGTSVGAVEVLVFRARRRFRAHYAKAAAGTIPTTGKTEPRCGAVRASLAAVLDDEQGAGTDRAAALTHVRTCPTCQAEIAVQRRDNRARALLPLLPLPLAVKGHVLAHLVSAAGTGATLATSSGAAGTATTGTTLAATSGPAAASGMAGAGSTAAVTATVAGVGAKVGVVVGSKTVLVVVMIVTATVALTVPLLRSHHPAHLAAPRTTQSRPARTATGGGSRAGTVALRPRARGTRVTSVGHTRTHRATAAPTAAPTPRLSPHPAVGRHVRHTAVIPAQRPVTPAHRTQPRTASPVTVRRVSHTHPARQVHAPPRSRVIHHAARVHVTLPAHTLRTPVHRPAQRHLVRHTAVQHRPLTRRHVVPPRPVVRQRVPSPKKVARRVYTLARRGAPRGLLRVVWPRGVLRFDQRQALRIHTRPGARIDVALRIDRSAPAHSRGPYGPRSVRILLRARADRQGDASVPLRYAYVPTRPLPVTVIVTVHDGAHLQQRSATLTLVRR